MGVPYPADASVVSLFETVKIKSHLPRLAEASVAVCFTPHKAFNKGRFNWGKVRRFRQEDKLWHPNDRQYDFLVSIPAEAWDDVLNNSQREALSDLYLSRCWVDYEPVTEEVTVKGVVKKKVVKDDWGRVEYTDHIKRDKDTDEPKWKVLPLDFFVFGNNVQRYGVWCDEILNFKKALYRETNE